MNTRLFLSSLALLVGCSGSVRYAPPKGDLSTYSKIVLANQAAQALAARTYEDALGCNKPVVFASSSEPGVAARSERTFHTKTGEPLTVSAWYTQATQSCQVHATFIPRAQAYRLVYDKKEGGCGVVILADEPSGERRVPASVIAFRKFHTPFFQSGPWCSELTVDQSSAIRATH